MYQTNGYTYMFMLRKLDVISIQFMQHNIWHNYSDCTVVSAWRSVQSVFW